MVLMNETRAGTALQRPWTMLTAALTAAHHGFELSSGVGLVGQPELGLVGASAFWGTQIPAWIALAAKGDKRWDKLLAVWSGAALGGAIVHFLIWPWRRSVWGYRCWLRRKDLVTPSSLLTTRSSTVGRRHRCSRWHSRFLGVTAVGPSWAWWLCRSYAFRPSTTSRGWSIRPPPGLHGGIAASKATDGGSARPGHVKHRDSAPEPVDRG